MTKPIKIALIGLGVIAKAQHLPAIKNSPDFELIATCDPYAEGVGVAHYHAFETLLEAHPELEAVSILTPPSARFGLAGQALLAKKAVLLEKPPCATLGEAQALKALADTHNTPLMAAWHLRFAPLISQAKDWLSAHALQFVSIEWKEDARKWHPGQQWLLTPAGMGVFDPGINALSLITALLDEPLMVKKSIFSVPVNVQAPIAAHLDLRTSSYLSVTATFDFRQEDGEIWDIYFRAEDGSDMTLKYGATEIWCDGALKFKESETEYRGIYDRFAGLCRTNTSDCDLEPLRIVADCALLAQRTPVDAYEL